MVDRDSPPHCPRASAHRRGFLGADCAGDLVEVGALDTMDGTVAIRTMGPARTRKFDRG